MYERGKKIKVALVAGGVAGATTIGYYSNKIPLIDSTDIRDFARRGAVPFKPRHHGGDGSDGPGGGVGERGDGEGFFKVGAVGD